MMQNETLKDLVKGLTEEKHRHNTEKLQEIADTLKREILSGKEVITNPAKNEKFNLILLRDAYMPNPLDIIWIKSDYIKGTSAIKNSYVLLLDSNYYLLTVKTNEEKINEETIKVKHISKEEAIKAIKKLSKSYLEDFVQDNI